MNNMWCKLVAVLLVCTFICSSANAYMLYSYEKEKFGSSLELDMYYSSCEIYKTFRKNISTYEDSEEQRMYWQLFKESLFPNLVLAEISAYPMPILGVYIKDQERKFYDRMEMSEGFNLVHSATVGFEEPYAYSIFFGNIAHFNKRNSKDTKGKAYMGYLLSYGDYHIHQNEQIYVPWMELEWKIKGEYTDPDKTMKWSFRLGNRLFSNDGVRDNIYVSLKRTRVDFHQQGFSLQKNSSFEWVYRFDTLSLAPVNITAIYGKSFPHPNGKYVFNLSLGIIWEIGNKYQGDLAWLEKEDDHELQIVIRPQISF